MAVASSASMPRAPDLLALRVQTRWAKVLTATGRPATADEIAEAIVLLATGRSSFVQGAKLAVDGGRTAI